MLIIGCLVYMYDGKLYFMVSRKASKNQILIFMDVV